MRGNVIGISIQNARQTHDLCASIASAIVRAGEADAASRLAGTDSRPLSDFSVRSSGPGVSSEGCRVRVKLFKHQKIAKRRLRLRW